MRFWSGCIVVLLINSDLPRQMFPSAYALSCNEEFFVSGTFGSTVRPAPTVALREADTSALPPVVEAFRYAGRLVDGPSSSGCSNPCGFPQRIPPGLGVRFDQALDVEAVLVSVDGVEAREWSRLAFAESSRTDRVILTDLFAEDITVMQLISSSGRVSPAFAVDFTRARPVSVDAEGQLRF